MKVYISLLRPEVLYLIEDKEKWKRIDSKER